MIALFYYFYYYYFSLLVLLYYYCFILFYYCFYIYCLILLLLLLLLLGLIMSLVPILEVKSQFSIRNYKSRNLVLFFFVKMFQMCPLLSWTRRHEKVDQWWNCDKEQSTMMWKGNFFF